MFLAHPLAVLAASFALGVLGARFVALPLGLLLMCGAACALFAVYCFVKLREQSASLLLVLAFGLAGAADDENVKSPALAKALRRLAR